MAEDEKNVAAAEVENAEAAKNEVVEYAWCPDMGIKVDHIRNLLSAEYGMTLAKDDPEWIVITILNAFLEKEISNNQKLLNAQKHYTNTNITNFVKAVETSSKEITKTLGDITVKELGNTVSEFRVMLQEHRVSLKFHTIINTILTIMNVTALATLIFFVFKAVK